MFHAKAATMFEKIEKYLISSKKRWWKSKHDKKNTPLTAPNINIYNQLTDFAFNFPVNTILYNGEHLWPYIRHHLLVQLTAVSIGNNKARELNPFRLQLGDPDTFDIDLKKEISAKYNVRFLEEIPANDQIEFLFFTSLNASEQIEIDSSIYYRITDPLFEIASHAGNARKIELIRNNSPAIQKTKRYLHKPLFVFSPHIVRSKYTQCLQLKDSLETYFKRYLPALQYNKQKLLRLIDWELHTRDFYLDLLRRLRPKAIFVPSFHYYAPLISAARELGIVTVDIQHGIQVGYNPLYNDWREIPSEGYKCLPDYFFVWGDKERNNIENVFGPHSSSKIIGNLWLKKQLELNIRLSSELESDLETAKKVVLLAMQSQTSVPQLFKDIILRGGDDILWLIRMHPKGKMYKPSDFAIKTDNIIISKEIDGLPLALLLRHVDVTLSEGSSIAAEGDAFGIPALITSETGRLNYLPEIEERRFHYITDARSFADAMSFLGKEKRLGTSVIPEIDVAAILKEIIDPDRRLTGRSGPISERGSTPC